MWVLLWSIIAFPFVLYLYIRRNDKALKRIPPEASSVSPVRCTPEIATSTAERLAKYPILISEHLPPRTGRRYIVIGGSGFLGGWIVLHLLKRGENPRRIRILDIRPPTRRDLTTGLAKEVEFVHADISDQASVHAAFHKPWPEELGETEPQITVFHTAANIRFYERHQSLISNSAKVNIKGTKNIIDAAKSVGASSLIYTSSGSVAVRRTRLWLWPWEKEPEHFVQVLDDADDKVPTRHEDFFSNYAATKIVAERKVRKADGSPSGNGVLRTGCIRPGNGVYGPGGDILIGAYLVRKFNPSWISHVLQSCIYVENCSLAHLCYEQRLIELSKGSSNPDIGGQAFTVTDPGPPPTYGDLYNAVETLDSETTFPSFSPSTALLFAHVIEFYYLIRHFLTSSVSSTARYLGQMLPPLGGDIVNLQPSMFALTQVHLIFDDSRARKAPVMGGLGYRGLWTTLEGLCKTVEAHQKSGGAFEERSKNGGVSFGFGLVRAERAMEKVSGGRNLDPVKAMN